jgi:ATP-binding cassette, subfamily B, bacterial
MSMLGTADEDRQNLSKEESRAVRKRSLRLLGSLLRPLRTRVILTAFVVVGTTAAQVAGPALIAFGVNQGLPAAMKGDWMPIGVVSAAFVVTGILGAISMAWYTVLTARVSQAVLLDLRKRVFKQTQDLSLEFHENYTSGRIIARQTSDLDSIRELLDAGLSQLVQGGLFMLFVAIAAFTVDPVTTAILICALLPFLLLSRWFQYHSSKRFRRTRTASARVIVHFVETMRGIRAVQAFRKEKRNEVEFAEHVEEYREANARVFKLFGVYEPGIVLLANITLAIIVFSGGLRVMDGTLAIGSLLAALLYARQYFMPTYDMAMFYNSYQAAASALEKISGVLEETPTVTNPTTPIDLWQAHGELEFDRVAFSYTRDAVVLPEFDLRIPAGQTIALVGTTGAGKSTLAKLLSRFYDPTNGRITLDGVDLRNLHPKDLRRAIVMVTQEAYLFSGTVAENIALGNPSASRDQIIAAAQAVGAHEFVEALPHGYDTDVNKRGGRVSAGQRQLLSFARAFLADPVVLILDEATASLDIPSERLVQVGLQTLLADRTAIIIAHRLSTVAIADRVLVMEHGRIVEDGSPAELIAGTGRFAQLHAAWRDSLV